MQVMLPYHDKYGTQELKELTSRVSTCLEEHEEAPSAESAKKQFRLLSQLASYGGRRIKLAQGMVAMARVHAERDVRQLQKLEMLFDAARKEGLLPAGFRYKAKGDAWLQAHRRQTQQDREKQQQQQHQQQQDLEGVEREPGARVGPPAMEGAAGAPGASISSGSPTPAAARQQHCVSGDTDMCEADTGVPPWRSMQHGHGDGEEAAEKDGAADEVQRQSRGGGEEEGRSSGGAFTTLREMLDDMGFPEAEEEEEGGGAKKASGGGEDESVVMPEEEDEESDDEEFRI